MTEDSKVPAVGRRAETPDTLAPDGSEIRLLLGEPEAATKASLCEVTLGVCPTIRSWRRQSPRNNLLTAIWTLSWSY